MTLPEINDISFYLTPTSSCNYLANRLSTTLFVDPFAPMNASLYSVLAEKGFRRSGENVYTPKCMNCVECVPIRIRISDFKPNRSQNRNLLTNRDITIKRLNPAFNSEHFALYQRYLSWRHPGGGMDNPDQEHYLGFLTSSWSITSFLEFRLQNKLLAIAVTDRLEQGISAVYTFFDPQYQKRGLGVYTLLQEIEEARRLGLSFLYLGYWIKHCNKMNYKTTYRPFELRLNGHWKKFASIDQLN